MKPLDNLPKLTKLFHGKILHQENLSHKFIHKKNIFEKG